jgi:hypothetical protein
MTRNNEDKDDVLRQLYLSFIHKEPIPKQVSSAFIEKYRKGSEGKIRSWNEVFGTPTRFGTGEKLKRQIKQEHIVLDEVRRLKSEGQSLNEEEFEAIGRRLGVGAKSKVKELLHDARLWAERLNFLYRRD